MGSAVDGLAQHYRITDGRKFRLKDHDPADIGGLSLNPESARELLVRHVAELAELQAKLAAQDRWALLAVLQAMDAGGKDGTIKHVMSGVNPQGVRVSTFKKPGPDELSHDFLWRIMRELPERGQIGVFNRSHYEEVLVVRVHPELLDRQRLPATLREKKHLWRDRLADIAGFESYLARQGFAIAKFFLNISKDEQKQRFLARLDEPEKHWKFSASDIAERGRWDDYMDAYEDAIAATAAPHAPWYIVPADHKWFAHLVVVTAMIEALRELPLQWPQLSDVENAALTQARERLEAE